MPIDVAAAENVSSNPPLPHELFNDADTSGLSPPISQDGELCSPPMYNLADDWVPPGVDDFTLPSPDVNLPLAKVEDDGWLPPAVIDFKLAINVNEKPTETPTKLPADCELNHDKATPPALSAADFETGDDWAPLEVIGLDHETMFNDHEADSPALQPVEPADDWAPSEVIAMDAGTPSDEWAPPPRF